MEQLITMVVARQRILSRNYEIQQNNGGLKGKLPVRPLVQPLLSGQCRA